MQQVNNTFGSAYKNQQLYALGSVQFSIPLMDHGAAKKRHEKATAWAKEETYKETAINYANGLCDINTFTLAESRWATAYTNYLAALEEFWVSHYHLQTLINYE